MTRPTTSSAESIFDDPRPLRPRDAVVGRGAGLLGPPALEAELRSVARSVLVGEGVDRPGRGRGELAPREVGAGPAGLQQHGSRAVEGDLVARRQILGLRQEDERQARLLVLPETPGRGLLL